MNKSLILVAMGLLAMIIVAGCSNEVKENTGTFRYYNTNPERVINIGVKDEFIIAMKYYKSFGDNTKWKTDFDSTMLELVDEGTELTDIVDPEAGYNYWFKFRARSTGETEVNMKYYIEEFDENSELVVQIKDWQVFTVKIK